MLDSDFLIKFFAVGIAVLGGIAKELNRYLRTNSTRVIVSRILAQMFVSGFSGYLAWEIVHFAYPDYAVVAAAVAGYYGGVFIESLSKSFTEYLKFKFRIK